MRFLINGHDISGHARWAWDYENSYCRSTSRVSDTRLYVVGELNPAPEGKSLPQEGKAIKGEELMHNGLVPSCSKALEA